MSKIMQKTKTKTVVAVALVTLSLAGIVAAVYSFTRDGSRKSILPSGGRSSSVSMGGAGGNNNNNNNKSNNAGSASSVSAGEVAGTKDLPYHVSPAFHGWRPADVEYYRFPAAVGTQQITVINDPLPSDWSSYSTIVKKGSPITKAESDAIWACVKKDGAKCNIYGIKMYNKNVSLEGPVYFWAGGGGSAWNSTFTLAEPLKETTNFYVISVLRSGTQEDIQKRDAAGGFITKHRMSFATSTKPVNGKQTYIAPPHTCGNNICEWGETGKGGNTGSDANGFAQLCPSDCQVEAPTTKTISCSADGYVFGGEVTIQKYEVGFASKSSIKLVSLTPWKAYIMKDGVKLCEGIGSQGAAKDRGKPGCTAGDYRAGLGAGVNTSPTGDGVGPNNLYYQYSSDILAVGGSTSKESTYKFGSGGKVICSEETTMMDSGKHPILNY